ncbi:MAG: metallophosphoesterase [Planctomycetes bacterium]|nr:metallophosphoesterase [Planctomycetota bacterium]MCC7396388.1 metallophosphoesterase [Planctomycetota bacterium]
MRARWIRRALWCFCIAGLFLNVLDDPPLRSGAYLTEVTTETATVARITRSPGSVVGRLFDASGQVVGAEVVSAGRRRHRLQFPGLRPDTAYRFELEVDGAKEAGSFRTAPDSDEAKVRFAFLGDSGGQPWWVWLQRTPLLHLPARWGWFADRTSVVGIGQRIADYRPDFVLHLGDVIYPKGLHAHYFSGYFRPFGDVLRTAPIYALLGNHDIMDARGQQMLANLRPPIGAATGDGRCFSFAYGPVRVIMLDFNLDLSGERVEDGHPAFEFLRRELDRCSEPWIVVASHFPIRSASRQGNTRADLMLKVMPLLRERGVSCYLSGHDHCYQRFVTSGDVVGLPLIVSGGGGKDLYDVRPDKYAAELRSAFHWCSAEVDGANMTITAHGLDGAQIDRVVLELPMAAELERLRITQPERAKRIDSRRRR